MLRALSINNAEKKEVGVMKTFSHWSNMRKCQVKFHFYAPDEEDLYPVMYMFGNKNGEAGAQEVIEKSGF